MTPDSITVSLGPLSVQMAADLQLPLGVNRDVIFPPAISLHLLRQSSEVEHAEMVADHDVYPYRELRRIMNDPSPSKKPASHAASKSVIDTFYINCALNPEYAEMSERRIRNDSPLFNHVAAAAQSDSPQAK